MSAGEAWAADVANRKAANNPYGLPTTSSYDSSAQENFRLGEIREQNIDAAWQQHVARTTGTSGGISSDVQPSFAQRYVETYGGETTQTNWRSSTPVPMTKEQFRQLEIEQMNASGEVQGPLPAGWNMRDAHAAQLAQQASRSPGAYMSAWDGKTADPYARTRENLGMAFVAPVAAAGLGAVVYAGGSAFLTGQLAKIPAAELGYSQLATGMATSGVFSAATYTLLSGPESTPAGVAVAFGAGALGGGFVKQGMNFAAQLPNTAIPFTTSNAVTQITGSAFGFGTVGWANASGLTATGQSWWTKPIYSPSSKP